MSKIGLIIKREYLTRVKKRSFIIMTILGPLLFAGFMLAVVLLSKNTKDDYNVIVQDDTYVLSNGFNKIENSINWAPTDFDNYQEALIAFKTDKKYEKFDFLLWLPENIIKNQKDVGKLIYRKTPPLKISTKITEAINKSREWHLLDLQFEGDSTLNKALRDTYAKTRTSVSITPIDISNIDESGNEIDINKDYLVGTGVGMVFSFIIFFFIFFFGSQVMRGVIEEKTNRIIEVIISSIRPFQLMMGKIIGVGFVGLTQFIFWGILTSILANVVLAVFAPDMGSSEMIAQMSEEMAKQSAGDIKIQNDLMNGLFALPWINILASFLFYFIAGYMIYSALFAAIGAAVDNEADTQQFMMPVVLPLILAFYVVAFSAFENPDSPAMFWLSIFPLTSPVVMLVRISMGTAELWEVLLSMGLLIMTFFLVVWIAGKVYRTGILMYGKKPSYKEVFKWIRYR